MKTVIVLFAVFLHAHHYAHAFDFKGTSHTLLAGGEYRSLHMAYEFRQLFPSHYRFNYIRGLKVGSGYNAELGLGFNNTNRFKVHPHGYMVYVSALVENNRPGIKAGFEYRLSLDGYKNYISLDVSNTRVVNIGKEFAGGIRLSVNGVFEQNAQLVIGLSKDQQRVWLNAGIETM